MALPIKNGKITTPFGKVGKHWSSGKHTGVDFAVPIGTPVLAVADGKIVNANWGKAYGKQVIMAVDGGFVIYAHLNAVRVKPGQAVKKGQIVGESGNSGNSTGPHLHLEYRNQQRWTGGTAIDPKDLLAS
jgi:murein DD-endopeptidase MepM/ murein hydrolase activator NlpD